MCLFISIRQHFSLFYPAFSRFLLYFVTIFQILKHTKHDQGENSTSFVKQYIITEQNRIANNLYFKVFKTLPPENHGYSM